MRFPGLSTRRSKTFLLTIGQLVLVAYVFQVAAFDHWRTDPARNITGVVNSDQHVTHCHGDSASCADAAGGFVTLAQDALLRLPAERASLMLEPLAAELAPASALVLPRPEPPRPS